MIEIKNFSGAVIFTSEKSATTREAVLHAVQSGANLSRAYLSRANLSRANLGQQWIIQGQTRSDGYPFFLQMLTGDKEPMVKAGCRLFTIPQAQAHWESTRANTPLGRETELIVRTTIETARIRGEMV